ncbi:DivIVA domain-containing protein [Micromonospora matsumotoense]|uniref:DivIVA domain-containing protein n=1 Tax=Micromonospora matsumotoense TaxID=121616 RepID=UPI003F4CBD31
MSTSSTLILCSTSSSFKLGGEHSSRGNEQGSPPAGAGVLEGNPPAPATFHGSALPRCPCGEVVPIVCRFLRLFRRPRSTTTDRPPTTERSAAAERPTAAERLPARHRVTNRPPNSRPPTNQPRSDRPSNSRVDGRPAGRAGSPGRRNSGQHYRSAVHRPLCASQVRQQWFGRSRNGLDPGEVDGFLHRIADELTGLHAELARTREENARIKGALRDWQSRFAPRVVRA